MVDLSGGLEGHLEFAFSNTVFIVPGIIVVSLSDQKPKSDKMEAEMDALRKLEDLIKISNTENPTRKQAMDLIENSEYAEEIKESLRKLVRGDVPQVFGSYGSGALLGILFVAVIFAVLLFFGYKLYKSIKEKEVKKEEKKKLKQMKKKK